MNNTRKKKKSPSYSHTATGKGKGKLLVWIAPPHFVAESITYAGVKLKKVKGTKGVYIKIL